MEHHAATREQQSTLEPRRTVQHGEPLVDRNVDFDVVENMVMCLEPRIVLSDRPDIGGAHLEDVVVVTRDGYEQINATPYDERLLD